MKPECSQCEAAARADIAHICDHVMDAMRVRALALPALGEAIATVAHAQMIARAAARQVISTMVRGGEIVELWTEYGAPVVGVFASVDHRFRRDPRTLLRFNRHPEDVAAEAVAAFIEECER